MNSRVLRGALCQSNHAWLPCALHVKFVSSLFATAYDVRQHALARRHPACWGTSPRLRLFRRKRRGRVAAVGFKKGKAIAQRCPGFKTRVECEAPPRA
eukprot:357837-Chlamydomonas_euryale.AAC.1